MQKISQGFVLIFCRDHKRQNPGASNPALAWKGQGAYQGSALPLLGLLRRNNKIK